MLKSELAKLLRQKNSTEGARKQLAEYRFKESLRVPKELFNGSIEEVTDRILSRLPGETKKRKLFTDPPRSATRAWRPQITERQKDGICRTCQWINGEPKDRNFCGDRTIRGEAWCPHHYLIVYMREE